MAAHRFGPLFERAIALIDEANALDPATIRVDGEPAPKELTHARMLTEWVERLRPDASEALLLAARAHHIRRWESPRDGYPAGRRGYLRWRRDLQLRHARHAHGILETAGYEEAVIERVERIIRKKTPRRDPEGQTYEDGLTLVFLETQLRDLAAHTGPDTLDGVLRKTWRKISPTAREIAMRDVLAPEDRALIERALGEDPPPPDAQAPTMVAMSAGDEFARELLEALPDRFAAALPDSSPDSRLAAVVTARQLATLVRATRASYVLHIGGELAYTDLHVAGAFGHTGQIEIVERSPRVAGAIREAAERHALADRMRIHFGDPPEVVHALNGPYDLAVLSGRWSEYERMFDDLTRLIRTGGALTITNAAPLADALARDPDEPEASALRRFLALIATDERYLLSTGRNFASVLAARVR